MNYETGKALVDTLRGQGKKLADIQTIIAEFNFDGDTDKLDGYLQSISIAGRPEKQPKYARTDTGNAERLVAAYGENIRYIADRDRWAIWNGEGWNYDNPSDTVMLRLCMYAARNIVKETDKEMSKDEFDSFLAWAKASESEGRLRAMASLARSMDGITVSTKEFDANPYLLNLLNGTVDLRTGVFGVHRQEDMLLQVAPVKYTAGVGCPMWLSFLKRVLNGDPALMRYIQKAVGYCLTGDTKQQIFFFNYGDGNNGKSTFMTTIIGLMGDYAMQSDTGTFMLQFKSSQGHNEGLANLHGKRLVASTEVEEGRRLAVTIVKQLTGGESIRASRKHEHEVEFKPICKLWFSGNYKPVITDTTISIWRRVKLIPFVVKIASDERLPDLGDDLKKEWPGILNWAIEGYLAYQAEGLEDVDAVRLATDTYKQEQDVLAEFIEDKCELGEGNIAPINSLYKAYKGWCEEMGQEPLGRTKFGKRLEMSHEVKKFRDMQTRYYAGISLNDERQEHFV